MTRLPPLAAVRAFEAAARHVSFTKAAEELFVTQSAISRHIRHLEDWLGVALFVRVHRGLTLTPEGERYRFEIASVFRRLASATERVRRPAPQKEWLNIHSFSTFAMDWLLPRLQRFKQACPGIDLRLTVATRAFQERHEQLHGIIGMRQTPFDTAQLIFPVALIPVCTPEYAAQHLPKGGQAELSMATLLHSIAADMYWDIWSQGVGFAELDLGEGPRFDSSSMAYVAARQHVGIAVAQFEFVKDDLLAGRLVAPFPTVVVSRVRGYYLSMRSPLPPAMGRFRDWLLAEVAAGSGFPDTIAGRPLRVLHEGA